MMVSILANRQVTCTLLGENCLVVYQAVGAKHHTQECLVVVTWVGHQAHADWS